MFKRHIHDGVSITQEALHSIKTKKYLNLVIKLELSKAYDRVNWSFIRLALIQMGMNLSLVNWIMVCIESNKWTPFFLFSVI
jgi:hypothetical protein